MNTPLLIASSAIAVSLMTGHVRAAIVVPGANGSDGVLNITANTEIDLSQAVTGAWDQNNAANAGKGVYDAAKWAVVFKYTSVNIASGAVLTFKNHPAHAPVVWLVNGAVTIAGSVTLNGQDNQITPLLAEGGPGGFRGGSASYGSGPGASVGFGPGGAGRRSYGGYGGSYGTEGGFEADNAGQKGATYGNPSLVPLLGGSGGAGDPEFRNSDRRGGGGGGGALLIASTGTVSITGAVRADGGQGKSYAAEDSGGGSGGGLRIVCDSLGGTGEISAAGGGGWTSGGLGRIRLERVTNSGTLQLVPSPSVVPLTAGATALIWPPATAPTVKVVSIGGQNAPADPRAGFGSGGPDVALPQTTTTQAVIETTNVEQASTVTVKIAPRAGAPATSVNATVSSVVSTSPLVVRWVADLPVNIGYSAVQVRVVRP